MRRQREIHDLSRPAADERAAARHADDDPVQTAQRPVTDRELVDVGKLLPPSFPRSKRCGAPHELGGWRKVERGAHGREPPGALGIERAEWA